MEERMIGTSRSIHEDVDTARTSPRHKIICTTRAGTEHAFHGAAAVSSRPSPCKPAVLPSPQRYPSVDGFLPTAAATRKYVKRTLGGISRTSFRGVTPAGSKHRSRVGDAAVHPAQRVFLRAQAPIWEWRGVHGEETSWFFGEKPQKMYR